MRAIIAIAAISLFAVSAEAVIVGNVPNVIPNTTVNPVDYPGWQQGDPGWNNVVAAGSNYVYLGDGWVLSARHVGYDPANGVTLQTLQPNGSPGPIETFQRIPGSYYFDYGYPQGNTWSYAVSNPTSIQSETGQTVSLMDSRGTYFTDLQLFRINGDPGLPSLTISSQPIASDFTRETAPEVTVVGRGRSRQAAESHWDVVQQSQDDWTWTSTSGPGTHQGYLRDSTGVKRFGTNRLADIRPNFNGDPADPGALNYTDIFEAVISDTTAVLNLETSDGATRDVISMLTVFDNQFAPGATSLEFQAISGNSGSGIFYNRGGQWELAGIVHATLRYPDQPGAATVYGNSTVVSDLSYYNQNYFNSIKYIIESHANYSHLGDVNLDGVVAGDGTGALTSDDVAAFVAGWGYDNGSGVGTITSWKNGDLNRDGQTNVQDFLMLRGALNGQISATVVAALFGDASYDFGNIAVPEPTTAFLLFAAAGWLGFVARFRQRRRHRTV